MTQNARKKKQQQLKLKLKRREDTKLIFSFPTRLALTSLPSVPSVPLPLSLRLPPFPPL